MTVSLVKTECPTCGSVPMGRGCYHICPNSDHFYSPEQERYDDAHYGEDDIRERYASTIADAALEYDYVYEDLGPADYPCPDCEDEPKRYAPDACPSCKR